MSSEAGPPRTTSDLLGAFGGLREALAGLRNLEHLLASVQVGPKLLAHVLPELKANSADWKGDALGLVHHAEREFSSAGSLGQFELHLSNLFDEIATVLDAIDAEAVSAKTRLALERDVRRLVPMLVTSIEHLEILVETTFAKGVPLSLAELLSSKPDIGSDRPYRPVFVDGDAASIEVVLPARVLLRALGTLVNRAGDDVCLAVRLQGESCRIDLVKEPRAGFVAHLPSMTSLDSSVSMLRGALGHLGVQLAADGLVLELPALACG